MNELDQWIHDHRIDYISALTRVEKTRTILLNGSEEQAADLLEKAYVNAVMSIQTPLERHERGFTLWASGDQSLDEAMSGIVYGAQKYKWIATTLKKVDLDALVQAIRHQVGRGRYAEILEAIVRNLKGVSYRKGAFTLAMAGLYEYLCIDRHVARYGGYEEKTGDALEFSDAEEYLDASLEIIEGINDGMNLPPFLLQWAVYDMQRGEHARHQAFFREVLPEVLWRD